MSKILSGLVIVFEKHLKEQVEAYLRANPDERIKVFYEDPLEGDKYIMLEVNRRESDNFSDWLNETLAAINYREHSAFFKQFERSILHINLPVRTMDDKFDLSLNTEQLIILRKLSTVFDIDYEVYLDISDI